MLIIYIDHRSDSGRWLLIHSIFCSAGACNYAVMQDTSNNIVTLYHGAINIMPVIYIGHTLELDKQLSPDRLIHYADASNDAITLMSWSQQLLWVMLST